MDRAAVLRANDIGAALPDRQLERLAAKATACVLAAGETSNCLEREGQVLLVVSGQLRVSALLEGRLSFMDVATGDWSGLADAMAGRVAGARAVLATSLSQALVWTDEDFLAVIKGSAAGAFAVARHFAKAALAAGESADPLIRVYRDILQAAKPVGASTWTVDPMPRHRELAVRSGVAEDEAAAAIAHLVRVGVARRRYPALDIDDREALKRLAAG